MQRNFFISEGGGGEWGEYRKLEMSNFFFDFLSAIDLLTYLEYIWIFPLEKLKKLRIFPPIHQFPTWRGGTTVHSHGAGGERGGGVLKLEKNFFAFLDVLDHLEAKKSMEN